MCKFAIMRKNDAFVEEISNTRQTKICLAIIAVAERLPTSATLSKSAESADNRKVVKVIYWRSMKVNLANANTRGDQERTGAVLGCLA